METGPIHLPNTAQCMSDNLQLSSLTANEPIPTSGSHWESNLLVSTERWFPRRRHAIRLMRTQCVRPEEEITRAFIIHSQSRIWWNIEGFYSIDLTRLKQQWQRTSYCERLLTSATYWITLALIIKSLQNHCLWITLRLIQKQFRVLASQNALR